MIRLNKTLQSALKIFKKNGGILRYKDAMHYGIHPRTLYQLKAKGLIEKIQRGLYCLPGLPGHIQPDFITTITKIPKGVICLISALFFHKLTTEIPHFIYLALPQGYKPPKLEYPPTKFYWFSKATYESGIEIHKFKKISVPIYSKEKTIIDCFKHRNKIGLNIAIEALRKYWKQKNPQLNKLLFFAKISKVEKFIKPYIELIINEH